MATAIGTRLAGWCRSGVAAGATAATAAAAAAWVLPRPSVHAEAGRPSPPPSSAAPTGAAAAAAGAAAASAAAARGDRRAAASSPPLPAFPTVVAGWGANLAGQLGVGHERSAGRPTPLCLAHPSSPITGLAAGPATSAALTADGRVYTCGCGAYGATGHGDDTNLNIPREVVWVSTGSGGSGGAPVGGAPAQSRIVAVALGGTHTLLVDAAGVLYTCGRALPAGHGGTSAVLSPTALSLPDGAGSRVVAVAAGRNHCLAVDDLGGVYAWGAGYDGALGLGTKVDARTPTRVPLTPVAGGGGRDGSPPVVTAAAAGRDFSLLLTATGRVLSAGCDDSGQLGVGRGHPSRYVRSFGPLAGPIGDATIIAVAAGDSHGLALDADGQVWAWGAGADGSLGDGQRGSDAPLARRVEGIDGRVVAVDAGGGHSAALTDTGVLYLWGRGRDGQLGRADSGREGQGVGASGGQAAVLASAAAYALTPVALTGVGEVTAMALGGDHTLALLRADGEEGGADARRV
ncbi:hypothetical protein MMPV_003483 [Pyropia vietnamensis]